MPAKKSMRYDITSLRGIQNLEKEFCDDLAKIYGLADPDDLPNEAVVDFAEIFYGDVEVRANALREALKGVPYDLSSLIAVTVDKMKALDKKDEATAETAQSADIEEA